METFELIAKTFQGLEEVLAKELTELGANDIQIGRRMVSFTGDQAMMYKANFCLRTAIRILKPIKHFQAQDADEIYEIVKQVPWENYMDVNTSFAVDSVVYSEEFRHSKFVAYRVKDAIADYFREKTGKRPSVQVSNPDLVLHIHVSQESCTLSFDSSGESLHRRGYRQEAVEAPLNEVLAAGLILMTGWQGECDFIDPMCGSGTLPIEAALIARNIAPGVFRKEYAFEKWTDFNQDLFDTIYNDDSNEREFLHHVYGYDVEWKAVNIATANVRAAGLSKDVTIEHRDLKDFEQPAEKAIMVTNPPYGERITTDDLLGLYRLLGERLKHAFEGNEAWIISYRQECFDKIGLKPSSIVPLFNGALPCEYHKYEIFNGKFKEFREGGEALNKEESLQKPRRPLKEREERAQKPFGEKRDDERRERRPRSFDGERPSRSFGDDRHEKPFDGERKPRFARAGEGEERRPRPARSFDTDTERFREDENYGTLLDRHIDFAKQQASKQRKEREAEEANNPERQERRSFERREGDRKPFRGGHREGDDHRPFRRDSGDRKPFRRDGDDHKPFHREGKDGKPFHRERREGENDRPFRGCREGDDRKSFRGGPRDGKPAFRKSRPEGSDRFKKDRPKRREE